MIFLGARAASPQEIAKQAMQAFGLLMRTSRPRSQQKQPSLSSQTLQKEPVLS